MIELHSQTGNRQLGVRLPPFTVYVSHHRDDFSAEWTGSRFHSDDLHPTVSLHPGCFTPARPTKVVFVMLRVLPEVQ